MEKFRIRIKRLGYDENTYKMFFNIEEMFLPEEYYPMNNMFLFVAMRFISYADTNNKNDAMFCSSLLIKMYNLVYHRFSTPEEELKKNSAKLLTKVVRGMLPKNRLGDRLITNLHVFAGAEHNMQAQQPKVIDINTLK